VKPFVAGWLFAGPALAALAISLTDFDIYGTELV
jgi:hypothetical protein